MSNAALEIIILAAGKGSRMRSRLPKVLHQVAGKPMLQHVIDCAKTLSAERIHVVTGHGSELVQEQCEHNAVNWVHQAEQLGTGHAVSQAIGAIDPASNVLILYGDVPLIQAQTLTPLVEAMSAFPLAILTARLADPTGYGRIVRDDANEIVSIVEQKDASSSQLLIDEINTGFVCARATRLTEWLGALDNNNAQQEYYLTDIVELAAKQGNPIYSALSNDHNETLGVNSPTELANIERQLQQQLAQQLMHEGVTLRDPQRLDLRGNLSVGQDCHIDVNVIFEGDCSLGDNVTIEANCVIKDSHIGDNSHIHSHSVVEQTTIGNHANVGPFARLRPGTQLGDAVRIGNFVETKKAVFSEGAKANHLSYVGDAQVGSHSNIGAGVITCNYDGANKHQTNIGDNVFVGSDTQLVAPVDIGDGATIGAGSTITANVEAGDLAISRAKQRAIKNWQRPVKK